MVLKTYLEKILVTFILSILPFWIGYHVEYKKIIQFNYFFEKDAELIRAVHDNCNVAEKSLF